MSISPRQIELVQQSFKQVSAMPDKVSELFYGRLFEIAPNVKPIFHHTNMTQQGRKLIQMLNVVVNNLNNLGIIVPVARDLGTRHIRYGVTNEMYDVVGQALIWTLEQGLGQAFTEEVQRAWTAVYILIAEAAKSAATEHLVNKHA